MLLIGNFGFIQDASGSPWLLLSASKYFSILFTDVYVFMLCFIFSIGLSMIGKNFGTLYVVLLIYYYINLFLSGVMIPVYSYDPNSLLRPNENWFKWIQYITPLGSGARLNQNITITSGWTWSSDWLAFVSPISQAICIYLIVWKIGFWRYHKNISKKKHFQ